MRDGLRKAALVGALVVAAVALSAAPGHAAPAQDLGVDGGLCRAQTERQGRLAGMPAHMLTALSHVESGRWDGGRQEKVAWPWTINAAGEGKIFPTKAAAVAEVRRLQAKGVRSIDVGCMQINLFYHGKAFPNLETAFDPAANVAYAIEFLTNLKTETGSWNAAAVRYHSATPEHANRYRAKLREEWTDLAASGRPPGETTTASLRPSDPPARTATLGQELAQARAEQAAERAARLEETSRQQAAARAFAEAWRAERLAAYRRAKADAS